MRSTSVLPAPFRSSNLAIPPSPFSPKFPISPSASTSPVNSRKPLFFSPTTQPPPEPLSWLWQCHICRHSYSLGTTRRCLEDGHYFCSGTTTVRRRGRSGKLSKLNRSCASEFDYRGWEAWGEWRREEQAIHDACTRSALSPVQDVFPVAVAAAAAKETGVRNCWANCDYPSECRWGRRPGRAQGMKTITTAAYQAVGLPPQQPATASVSSQPSSPLTPSRPPITFDSILQRMEGTLEKKSTSSSEQRVSPPKAEKEDFWSVLLSSAKRRKSTASAGETPLVHSPLASSPVTTPDGFEAERGTEDSQISLLARSLKGNEVGVSSFEVKSFRKISANPVYPLGPLNPASQCNLLGSLCSGSPIVSSPAAEVNLDVLVEGLGLERQGHAGTDRRVSVPDISLQGKQKGRGSYVEKLRQSSAQHLSRSKTA